MALVATYKAGDELPGLTFPWQEETAPDTFTDLDLSSGYTCTVTLVDRTGTETTPSATVAGYGGGVTVDWATGDLDDAGTYTLLVKAREIATSKDRTWNPLDLPTIRIVD